MMERFETGTTSDLNNETRHATPALREPMGSMTEVKTPEDTSGNGKLAGMLTTLGISNAMSQKLAGAINSPQVRKGAARAGRYVKTHPAQVAGAVAAVAAGIIGMKMISRRRTKPHDQFV